MVSDSELRGCASASQCIPQDRALFLPGLLVTANLAIRGPSAEYPELPKGCVFGVGQNKI